VSDDADLAQRHEQRERRQAIAAVQAEVEASAFRWAADCIDCADPLDEDRVQACPGATRCITCQEAFERRRALFPRTHP